MKISFIDQKILMLMLIKALKLLKIMFVITEFVNNKLNINNNTEYTNKTS